MQSQGYGDPAAAGLSQLSDLVTLDGNSEGLTQQRGPQERPVNMTQSQVWNACRSALLVFPQCSIVPGCGFSYILQPSTRLPKGDPAVLCALRFAAADPTLVLRNASQENIEIDVGNELPSQADIPTPQVPNGVQAPQPDDGAGEQQADKSRVRSCER